MSAHFLGFYPASKASQRNPGRVPVTASTGPFRLSGPHCRQRGFTLLESVICMAILSILVSIVLPTWTQTAERARMQGHAAEILADLMLMRSTTVARNRDVRLSVGQDDLGTCYVIYEGPSGSCRCAGNERGVCMDPDNSRIIKVRHWLANEGLRVESSISTIGFDPRQGLAAPAGTLRLVGQKGQQIRHVVSLRGRVRSCAVNLPSSGHPDC